MIPPTVPVKGKYSWELIDGMAKLMGITVVIRGAATMVMFAVPTRSAYVAYPGKVTAREQEVQARASQGTTAEILVLLMTMQFESGRKADAF